MQRLQEVLPAFLFSANPSRVYTYAGASDGQTVFQRNVSTMWKKYKSHISVAMATK